MKIIYIDMDFSLIWIWGFVSTMYFKIAYVFKVDMDFRLTWTLGGHRLLVDIQTIKIAYVF